MDLPDILERKRKIDETEGPIDRITHEMFLRDALEVLLEAEAKRQAGDG